MPRDRNLIENMTRGREPDLSELTYEELQHRMGREMEANKRDFPSDSMMRTRHELQLRNRAIKMEAMDSYHPPTRRQLPLPGVGTVDPRTMKVNPVLDPEDPQRPRGLPDPDINPFTGADETPMPRVLRPQLDGQTPDNPFRWDIMEGDQNKWAERIGIPMRHVDDGMYP